MSNDGVWIKEEEDAPSPASAFAAASSTNTDTTTSNTTYNQTTTSTATTTPSSSSSSLTVQKPKRARTSKPKVKTGCSNCKLRRIKCDEARPACTQCVRSNKVCTGYPPPARPSRPFEEVRIAPKPMPLAPVEPPKPAGSTAAPAGPAPLHREVVLPPRRARHKISRTASPAATAGAAVAPASQQQQQHQQQQQQSTAVFQQPSLSLPFQPTEGRYFDIFRSSTASELSGYFDSAFWTRRVLQECHSEAAIRHAVVALGALYKTLQQSAEAAQPADPSPGGQTETSTMGHWRVAVKQYSEACNALVLLNNQDQRSHKTLIMASVLLACFDSFIGDHKQAIIQIQNGLGLLERIRVQKGKQPVSGVSGQEASLEQELITMFTRLAIQAKSYDMAFHFPQPYVIKLTSRPQDPDPSPSSSGGNSPISEPSIAISDRFTSLLEARTASDRLSERMLRFIEELFAAKTDTKWTLPQSWREYGTDFKHQLEAWSDAFDPMFYSRISPSVTPQEKAGIAAMKMLQVNSSVLFMMMFSDQESQFDAFLPQFRTIVELGLEVVSDEERRMTAEHCQDPSQCPHLRAKDADMFPGFAAPHIRPSFSADLGIIPPLFVVATKCRDPMTRLQAIQLLRSSARREAMWDSEMAAQIATWVMNVEAGPAESPSTVIPEEKRVAVRSVDFDLRARFADLTVGTRGLQSGQPDSKYQQAHLSW